ncbi:MAG: glycosyltransferase family 2 protein [Caldilineae bacterium]|nr:MAG: glycosyltransferase family 2 protein [Caldilineae bacterium]
MSLSVIIVNWNVKDLLRDCLRSVFASPLDPPPEVIVVDNASADGSPAMVQREFPQVNLIASPRNLGYAGGNNLGAAEASGNFLLLLNPDTRLHPDALHLLRDYLLDHPQVGVAGPQLLWPDGRVQSSRRRFPTPATLFWESTLLEQWFPGNAVARRYRFEDVPPDRPLAVDWLVGAALCIRREAWQAAGPLDESFFMYFEETDWCRRCAAAGWAIHYLPQAKVVHYEGQSSGQVLAARTLRFQRSKIRYAEKWFGRGWAIAVRLFLLATFGLQWLEESAKWLIGHKRPLRRERIAAYGQVLRGLGVGSEE